MTADLDCRDLAEVRRRVVEPVVHAVLRPDEVESVDVVVEIPPDPRPLWPRASDQDRTAVRVVIRACGETLDIFLGPIGDEPWDARETADWFYDSLTEELPETRFAWGELREGRYDVPGPGG